VSASPVGVIPLLNTPLLRFGPLFADVHEKSSKLGGDLLKQPDEWRLVETNAEARTLRVELLIVLPPVSLWKNCVVVNERIGLVVGTVVNGVVGALTRRVRVRVLMSGQYGAVEVF
jgi:hypothetical protein